MWQHLTRYGVCELYSPPRVMAWASKHGLPGGWSLDLARGWDLSADHKWNKANDISYRDWPWLIDTSPPCYAFSASSWGLHYQKQRAHPVQGCLERRRVNLRRSMEATQIQNGTESYDIHEHPW